MIETSGIFVKFPYIWMVFVDSRVLSKSTMRLAYLSTLWADPQATGGRHSGWIEEGRSGDVEGKGEDVEESGEDVEGGSENMEGSSEDMEGKDKDIR